MIGPNQAQAQAASQNKAIHEADEARPRKRTTTVMPIATVLYCQYLVIRCYCANATITITGEGGGGGGASGGEGLVWVVGWWGRRRR